MRIDQENFATKNTAENKSPYYVVEISFDSANTDLLYVTSNANAALPIAALSIDGVLEGLSGTSQKVVPEKGLAEIGNISFSVTDKNGAMTTYQYNKLQLGDGLNGKRIRVYVGYEGLTWAEYGLITTQIIETVTLNSAEYMFNCSDIQRLERKKIFDLAKTNLSQDFLISDSVMNVYSTAEFEAVAHGNSYSDAPSTTVYYVKIDDEIVRATGKTDTTFTGCVHGVLNTKEADHIVDVTASADRRSAVDEYVYLEMPAPKLIYALLTGILNGQGGSTLPTSWHLGIDTSYVKLTDFTDIGNDLYDTTDDRNGFPVRFTGLTGKDGKRFIETELLLLMGCFSPVYGTGEIGLRRMSGVLSNSSYKGILDEDNVVSTSTLIHDMNSVFNNVSIAWNYLDLKERFTRRNILRDSNSVARHGLSTLKEFEFLGLYGGIHSSETLGQAFNAFRDRYTSPPLRINVTCLSNTNMYEVGDTVRLSINNIKDYNLDAPLDRTFEIQNVSIDWITGETKFSLFGSAGAATPLSSTAADSVIADAWYISEGNNLATYVGAGYDFSTDYEDIGGIGHIKTSSELFGGATTSDAVNSIYYHDGDLVIDDGVTLTINDNVQLRVKGFLTINGSINGVAKGLVGGADRKDLDFLNPTVFNTPYKDATYLFTRNDGTSGFLGSTKSMGGWIAVRSNEGTSPGIDGHMVNVDSSIVSGLHEVAPDLNLIYENSTVNGIPTDLRGTSGSSGGNSLGAHRINWCGQGGYAHAGGGAGGNGGAGLVVISRGAGFGVSGEIDLSGGDGELGSFMPYQSWTMFCGTSTSGWSKKGWWGGSGAAGSAGALYFVTDGASQTFPDLANVKSNFGSVPIPTGTRIPWVSDWYSRVQYEIPTLTYPHYQGIGNATVDLSGIQGASRVLFVTGSEVPEEDVTASIINPPTTLVLSSGTADLLLNEDGTITARIKVSWTAPTDPRVTGYNVQYKKSADSVWINSVDVVGEVQSYISPIESGISYDVRIRSGDNVGETSNWVSQTSYLALGKSAPPEDVQNFYVYTNGIATVFKWDQVTDVDLAGYEIRYVTQSAATNWGDGIRLTSITRGTNVTSVDVPDGDWTFMIKAIDTSGNQSVTATTADLSIVSDYDVVSVTEESPAWAGTLTNMIKLFDNTLMPDDQNTMDSYNTWADFESALPTPYADSYYEIAVPIDMLFDTVVRVWALMQSTIHPLDLTGLADPHADISYSLDGGSYNAFAQWSIGTINARYVKLRVHVITSVGIPIISGMQNTVDAIERSETGTATIGATGTVITFDTQFHLVPFVEVQVQSATFLVVTYELLSETSFKPHVFNSAGTEVGGTISWKATGV